MGYCHHFEKVSINTSLAITNNHAKILALLISKLNNSQQIKMEIESDQRLLSPGKKFPNIYWN